MNAELMDQTPSLVGDLDKKAQRPEEHQKEEAVGHPVSKLRRVQFGPLADPFLKPGAWRYLGPQEIAAIKSL